MKSENYSFTIILGENSTISSEDIENAIDVVLGKDVSNALRNAKISLPSRHKDAALKCFLENRQDRSAEILRTSLDYIQENGYY